MTSAWVYPAAAFGAAAATNLAPALLRVDAVRRRFPVLHGDGFADHVALSFDDGPDPASTPAFLDELDRLDVRATFFLLGSMVARAPRLAETIVARGHEVGVHGWRHRSLAVRGPGATYRDLAVATAVIRNHSSEPVSWWRPPYGVVTAAGLYASARLGLRPVLWGSWGRDWTAVASPSSVLASLNHGLRPGCTVLLHDSSCTSAPASWRAALAALPQLVERCRERGLRVGPLCEHGIGS